MNSISDFLIGIKNAGMAGRTSISTPFSDMKFSIAKLLSKRGFLGQVGKKGRKNGKSLEVGILYNAGKPRIADIKLVSKPSRRQYGKAKELRPYKQGYGLTVLSTPKGILSDSDARKENVGGEVLFKIH